MRDQRRLLAARALRRDPGGARRRPALRALARVAPARLLPQLRARAGAGARRARATSRSPTRTTAGTPTSSRRCWPSSATPSSSTATRAWSTATAACSPTPTGAGAATTTATCCRCWWRTRSPAPPRSSRAALLDDALPFPPAQFAHFHDHWLALVALSLGDIAFVERPLYDYVQHGGATLGHAAANRMPGMRERLEAVRRDPRERIRLWRMHYYVDVCRLLQFTAILRLRCWPRMAPAKRRALERFERADRSLAALAGLTWRGAQELLGRRRDTLGAEWMLAHALRLAAAADGERPRRADAASRASTRCRRPPSTRGPAPARPPSRPCARSPRRSRRCGWRSSDDAPRRVNLLIPSIDLQHFFGGYIGKFNLARRLAARGERVRIVTVDPVGSLPRELAARRRGLQRARRDARRGRGRVRARVAGDRGEPRRHADRHHVVDRPHRRRGAALARRRALPLPDPGVRAVHVPDGLVCGAGGRELHVPPHRAVLDRAAARLLPPPRARRLRGGAATGDAASASFDNAITAIDPPTAAELAGRSPRRLLFYARPEPHAARNMFELGVLALSRARGARRVRRRLGAARHRLGARRPAARPRRRRADGAPPARAAGRLRRLHAPRTTSASR